MGVFKGFKLFGKKSAKKEAVKEVAEPAPAVEEKAVVEPVQVAEPIAETATPTAEPAEPAKAEEAATPAEDTVEALPEAKAVLTEAKDDASTVAESVEPSKDGDAPAAPAEPLAEPGTETPKEEVAEFIVPTAVAMDDDLSAKPTGWFSCTMCK